MAYPSAIGTLTDPLATQTLNSPSHSSIHAAVNAEVKQVETFVGTLSSAVGTLVYDIRAAASGGGGHVQTAALGGTGQTTYLKGDLIVGQDSSTLTRLGVSATAGDVLTVDSNQQTGVKWAHVTANRIAINTSSVLVSGGAASVATVLFSASILGSTLGTGNGVRFTGVMQNFQMKGQPYILIVNYGNNVVASVTVGNTGSILSSSGELRGMIVGNGGTSSQLGFISFNTGVNQAGLMPTAHGLAQMSSSVESSSDQNLVITGNSTIADTGASVLTGLFVVEKIV